MAKGPARAVQRDVLMLIACGAAGKPNCIGGDRIEAGPIRLERRFSSSGEGILLRADDKCLAQERVVGLEA